MQTFVDKMETFVQMWDNSALTSGFSNETARHVLHVS